jgi:RNA polymerase sigma factor (sigma-70 family)
MTCVDGEPDDEELMRALSNGKDAALDQIITRHQHPLFSFLFRFLQNESDANDLAEETFVKIYQNKDRFDPRLKFTTWMFQIASNLAKDRLRWRARHPHTSLESESSEIRELTDAGESPDVTANRKETGAMVQLAVSKLPEELRLPFILSQYEERSHKEIGEILRCSPKAVETRVYRARQILRKNLAAV